jgi:hypothetical protein
MHVRRLFSYPFELARLAPIEDVLFVPLPGTQIQRERLKVGYSPLHKQKLQIQLELLHIVLTLFGSASMLGFLCHQSLHRFQREPPVGVHLPPEPFY